MRLKTFTFTVMALALLGIPAWGAGTDTVVLDVGAAVASSAQLTLGASVIHFPDADPDTTPIIPAQENPLSVSANVQTGNNKTVTLTVLVSQDLTSGSNTIAANNVSWTATGTGYSSGTVIRGTPLSAGRWRGPGTYNGTFSYFFNNSWTYKAGSYSTTATYTLYAP